MRRGLILIVAMGVAALDWAALHDILRGVEADLWLEYGVLVLSLPALALLGLASLRCRTSRGDRLNYGDR